MHRTGYLLLFAALLVSSVTARASEQQGALVLVAGGTGRTGMHLVAQLLASSYRGRALTRDVERASQALPASVELIEGEVRETESLPAAVRGVRYVILAAGSNSRRDLANTTALGKGRDRSRGAPASHRLAELFCCGTGR